MKLRIFVLVLISLFIVDDINAQRRRKKKRRTSRTEQQEEQTKFTDKLNYEIKLGGLNFNGGFGLGLKGNAGYKLNKSFSAGVGTKLQYNFLNFVAQPDVSLIDIGGFGYLRGKITESIYLQGEYNLGSFDNINGIRNNIVYPTIGGGYLTGGDGWSSGLEVLFILNDEVRNINNQTIEYWVSFSYNF